MFYKVLKNAKHPFTKRNLEKGQIISLFHTVGDQYTKGKGAFLARTSEVDQETKDLQQFEADKENEE